MGERRWVDWKVAKDEGREGAWRYAISSSRPSRRNLSFQRFVLLSRHATTRRRRGGVNHECSGFEGSRGIGIGTGIRSIVTYLCIGFPRIQQEQHARSRGQSFPRKGCSLVRAILLSAESLLVLRLGKGEGATFIRARTSPMRSSPCDPRWTRDRETQRRATARLEARIEASLAGRS